MKFRTTKTQHLLCCTLTVLTSFLLLNSCQKEIKKQAETSPPSIQLPPTTNPYSLRNVQKAQAVLAGNHSANRISDGDLPQYIYLKFDPNNITKEEFQALEDDSTVRILDFPFANGAIYNDEFALDDTKAAQLKDGGLYAVTSIENPLVQTLKSSAKLQTQVLDTLALIPEEDTTLQFQAMKEAGYTDQQLDQLRLRICLFKRPTGYVRYWDDQLPNNSGGFGRLEPVRNMQVWGLVFGIPLHTYTDGNGYYRFPWRFNIGTIMGTHAKNSRVNVKPFNTMGNWLQVIPQLIANFIVGSVHIRGWVTSCQMRNDVNFDFYTHRQNKFWSLILNAYYFHDSYTQQDGIDNAPQRMVCYAHWADAKGFGNASTPMLYHMTGGQYTDAFLQVIFSNPVTGQLLSLVHGLLPDMTFKVSGLAEPSFYTSRFTQTAFHELGHASHYRKVGTDWYLSFVWAELWNVNGSGYGTPGYNNWGKVQVGESWAEFIGTQHAIRRYGRAGVNFSTMLGWTTFGDSEEKEDWYDNNWIPSGAYFDLIDKANAEPSEDSWDLTDGSNIWEMFNVFNPKISDMCDYREKFIAAYPSYDPALVRNMFTHYALYCK